MLYVLRITGDAPAAVVLNGQLAGELTAGEMELPVAGGPILIQLYPLESSCLPATGMLELCEDPKLRIAEGIGRLYLLPDQRLHLRIHFERILREQPAMPYILRKSSAEGIGQVTVYFDRTCNFALERNGRILLGGAFEHSIREAQIRRRRNFLLIEGSHTNGTEFFGLGLSGEPRVLLHKNAVRVELQENLLEYDLPGEELLFRIRYAPDEGKIVGRELRFLREPKNLFAGLLEAVREGAEDFAMSLISPSLKTNAGFADFCAFFGEYDEYYEPPKGNEIGLCYPVSQNVRSVRNLRATIKNEQIWNIDEI